MELLEERIKQFSRCKIAVIGDLVADEYIFGKSHRISREAPVIILKHSHDSILLGGAANAAHNVAALGGTVFPIGIVGNDSQGDSILEMLKKIGIDTGFIVTENGRKTVSKTRVLGCGHHTTYQQLVRIDRDNPSAISNETENSLIVNLSTVLSEVDAVIVSDYHHGVFSDRVIAFVNKLSESNNVPIFVDSRFNLLKFHSFFTATPNETEVEDLVSTSLDDDEAVEKAAFKLLETTCGQSILITRGNKGMCLLEKGGTVKFIPIHGTDEVADVTGAGDTVMGVLAMAVASGASMLEGAYIANVAGGMVVMKNGTATLNIEELTSALKAA